MITELEKKYEEKYLQILKGIIIKNMNDNQSDVFLFGSRARNNYYINSDYDIGVTGLSDEEFKSFKRMVEQETEESIIPHRVDIINFDKVDKDFREIALKDCEVWKNI